MLVIWLAFFLNVVSKTWGNQIIFYQQEKKNMFHSSSTLLPHFLPFFWGFARLIIFWDMMAYTLQLFSVKIENKKNRQFHGFCEVDSLNKDIVRKSCKVAWITYTYISYANSSCPNDMSSLSENTMFTCVFFLAFFIDVNNGGSH